MDQLRPKRKRSDERHAYYEKVQKESSFNQYFAKSFINECLQGFKQGTNKRYTNYLKTTLFPEAFNVYGNVYDKMNRLYTLLSEQSTFQFDQLPPLKQFLSGASWAIFTPSLDVNMELEYDKCRDLCELECQQLTEDKRKRSYSSLVFCHCYLTHCYLTHCYLQNGSLSSSVSVSHLLDFKNP